MLDHSNPLPLPNTPPNQGEQGQGQAAPAFDMNALYASLGYSAAPAAPDAAIAPESAPVDTTNWQAKVNELTQQNQNLQNAGDAQRVEAIYTQGLNTFRSQAMAKQQEWVNQGTPPQVANNMANEWFNSQKQFLDYERITYSQSQQSQQMVQLAGALSKQHDIPVDELLKFPDVQSMHQAAEQIGAANGRYKALEARIGNIETNVQRVAAPVQSFEQGGQQGRQPSAGAEFFRAYSMGELDNNPQAHQAMDAQLRSLGLI